MTLGFSEHIDIALIVLYAFWIFFFALIFYLRREDRREGYPLEVEVTGRVHSDSAMWMPKPKFWTLPGGVRKQAPQAQPNEPEFHGRRISKLDGAPYEPTGNPLTDGFGPASYALRDEVPDMTGYGDVKITPLRAFHEMDVVAGDVDPRGLSVVSRDGKDVGTVSDLWVDRSESLIRYYEIELPGVVVSAAEGEDEPVASSSHRVLVPYAMATLVAGNFLMPVSKRHVRVSSLNADQFADVPTTKSRDQVTRREEDRISAYYAGGQFFNRVEPAGSLT
ncbi:MAG: photosynthetic reaction center subunit H [Alphaproteobacteria bacterium]|nr:photosynthetic reaction center subunit H [Alphaproteobacteria bacterium]